MLHISQDSILMKVKFFLILVGFSETTLFALAMHESCPGLYSSLHSSLPVKFLVFLVICSL